MVFTLHSTGVPKPDPETGPVTKFHYSRSGNSSITCTCILYHYISFYSPSGSPYPALCHMMSILIDLTVRFLECVLSNGPIVETVLSL